MLRWCPAVQATCYSGERLLATGTTAPLDLGPPPETARLPLLFDTEASWLAWRDGEDVLLGLRSPIAARPRAGR